MVEKVMDTPMPESSSKLVELDYTEFLKKDSEHLSCPDCEIIPAIFIEKDSKNCFRFHPHVKISILSII